MFSSAIRHFFPVIVAAGLCASGAMAQTQDISGNAQLNGVFRFRHVAVQNVDSNFNPTQITASYGTITFDGKGKYAVVGFSVDNTVAAGVAKPLAVSGTYAIGANGAGYVSDPLYPTDVHDYIYGAVAQGIYTGSSTESEDESFILNDVFVAIPVGTALTNAGFTTQYQGGLLDFGTPGGNGIKDALFALTPDGKGGLGTITLSGQAAAQGSTAISQSIAGATYNFAADGTATLTLPLPNGVSASNALLTGTKTAYVSADGNFVLGWTNAGYDIFFGVKALGTGGTNALTQGLYFTAALEDWPGSSGTDSFYGATVNSANANGDAIVHQRVNLSGAPSFDYGVADQINVNSDGTTGVGLDDYQYVYGAAGQAFVAVGTSGDYALMIGTHAPNFTGSGVFLNPVGVSNAASFQPVTASIAPGELLVLYGSGLASGTIVTPGAAGFPTTLGGVSVTFNGTAAAIYYVSPTQMSVIVPYGLAANQTGLANIQVNNNGQLSNVVQVYLTDAAPGSFSQGANGIGLAASRHALTGQLITTANPAQASEFISLYLTGLGPVTPPIADGAVGPSSTLSWADVYNAGNLSVSFFGTDGTTATGTIQYAGLTPTLGGLYQINVQMPSTGLTLGQNVFVQISTDAAVIDQIQVPFGNRTGSIVNAGPGAMLSRAHGMQARRAKAQAASDPLN